MPDAAVRSIPPKARLLTTLKPVPLLLGLAATTAACGVLVIGFRLGASWPVALAATVATAATLAWAGATRTTVAVTLLVVGTAGAGYIEAINIAQYGTASLHGAPPRIFWCGDWFRPSGAVAPGVAQGDAPAFTQILTTPAGLAVFGAAPRQPGTLCGPTGPILVRTGSRHYLVYNP